MRLANSEPNRLAVKALQIEPSDTVLELGFGPGHAIQLILREAVAGRVYGVDHSSVMLEQAARRNCIAIRDRRVMFYQTQFDRLPFRDQSIDKILAVNVIYFWSDLAVVLKEICRVLRPGGRVSIFATDQATMRRWKFAGRETHRLYCPADLSSALQREGLDIRGIHTRKVRLFGRVQGFVTTFTMPPRPSSGGSPA